MVRLHCIAAVCENGGIGINGDLPWHLQRELRFFSTTTKKVLDPAKRNAVIMGRKTYFGVPEGKRPLQSRLNIVLTRSPEAHHFPDSVVVCTSLQDALRKLETTELGADIEKVWIVGGYSVYKEAMESDRCDRLYITEVKRTFECDAFFPTITDDYRLIANDPDVPTEVQEENGLQYQYRIYEKQTPQNP